MTTTTKAKTEPKAEQSAAAKQEVAVTGRIGNFEVAFKERFVDLSALIPSHVNGDRFRAAAIEAIRRNPDLLDCTKRSLFDALGKSAKDGLLPDGREGVITKYKDEASWNPMIYGLRKRARELDDLIIQAEVVYATDHFIYKPSELPKDQLEHHATPLGQTRGGMIGAWARFRRAGDDKILHVEVMDKHEIETAQKQSKKPDSVMWSKFPGEAWKKVVARRGFKSVPVSEKLEEIIRREDELYGYDQDEPEVEDPAKPKATVKGVLDKIAGVTDAEVIDQETGEVTDREPEGATLDQVAEGVKEAAAKQAEEPLAAGGVRYSPEQSGMNRDIILSALKEPMKGPELAALVDGYEGTVGRMTAEDARKVVEALDAKMGRSKASDEAKAALRAKWAPEA